MKKKSLSVLLAASLLALSASACGTDNTPPSEQETPDTAPADNGDTTDTEETDDTEISVETTDGGDTVVITDDSADSEETSAIPSPVSVTFEETSDEIKADDGTVLLENSSSMPVVAIEGADEIAAKINADIETHYNLSSDEETLEMAKSDYEASQADEDGGWFHGYAQSVTANVTRMDDKVLSLEITAYSDTGGAHGNYGVIGKNYNVKTGELISLADLTDDYDAFHATALDYIVNLAETPTYQEKLFGPSKDDLDNALFEERNWIFTQSGISFMSDPYALGPYAAGEIYFRIPYEKAYDLGLKEEYRYDGNFMEERYYTSHYDTSTMETVIDGTPEYSFDLNGDGTEEGIAFYGQIYSTESSNKSESEKYGLYIDGTNWGNVVWEALGDAPSNGYPENFYALYDSDPSDDLTEIAVLFTEFGEYDEETGRSDTHPYTYLFQYTAENELQFKERLDGYITNPLSVQ